ncbi:MAG: hypothetical protein Q8O19_07740, partial [Rectinemataceae bacterium]|nr:hypothetical protein [Rectinemataceae bacterium]
MSTTAGFDLAVQLSEQLLNRILIAIYLKEVIPHFISKAFNYAGYTGKADVVLKPPAINFDVTAPGLSNPVEMRFPLRVTAKITSPAPQAFTIDTELAVTAEVENKTELYTEGQQQQTLNYVDISFANVPDNRFTVNIKENKYKIYEPVVKYLVMQVLKTQVVSLPLSPVTKSESGAGGPAFKAMHLKVVNDTTPSDMDFLALLVNVEGLQTPLHPIVTP